MSFLYSFIARRSGSLKQQGQNETSATYLCQLHISHVSDDVSWEGDKDRLEGKAPSVLHAYPQQQTQD